MNRQHETGARTVRALGWIGAATMVVASFSMDGSPRGYLIAIAGLSMLSIQARALRAWNLVALNCASILGFAYNLFA